LADVIADGRSVRRQISHAVFVDRLNATRRAEPAAM